MPRKPKAQPIKAMRWPVQIGQRVVDLSKTEWFLLCRLYMTDVDRYSLAAAVKLVEYGFVRWCEPDGTPELTPLGIAVAKEAGLEAGGKVAAAEAKPVDVIATAFATRQLRLGLFNEPRPRLAPVDALCRVLGNGPGAEEQAAVLLENYPNGRGLSFASPKALMALGLREAQAEAVTGAFALARACLLAPENIGTPLVVPDEMARAIYVGQSVGLLESEHFWVAALDVHQHLVHVATVAKGDISSVNVSMTEILRPVIRCSACGFFVAHNHPSGNMKFSIPDIKLTQRIYDASRICGLDFRDHILLSPTGSFLSIVEQGYFHSW